MKMSAFWDIALCSLIEVDQHFRGAYCLHHRGYKTSVYFNDTTWCYILESCHLHNSHHENLKSQKLVSLNLQLYGHVLYKDENRILLRTQKLRHQINNQGQSKVIKLGKM
jgi:outer membrane phospholipase A